MNTCKVEDCIRKLKGHGYCEPHLRRVRKYGDPLGGSPIRLVGVHAHCTAQDCEAPIKGHGYCAKHWQRWRNTGTVLVEKERRGNGKLLEELRNLPESSECISLNTKRRPTVRLGGVTVNASRAVWILHRGDPGPSFVLHTCDNEQCVNPEHLYLGDQAQNMRDTVERNRRRGDHPMVGEKHYNAKLTREDVLEIRRRHSCGESRLSLSSAFNVSRTHIGYIVGRKSWKSVD